MIRVLIKASSPVVKAGLESLLRSFPQLQVIDELSDELDSSDSLLTDSRPDVVLAETDNGESAAEVIESLEDGTPLILLVRDPAAVSADAFRRGVRAVLPSNLSGPQIAAVIQTVAAGLGVFDPGAVEQFPALHAASESAERLPEPLTPREIEVLRAMAEGLANKEIAARLGISENTIKFHVASVMGKLGAGSRTEAVMLGIRHGIVLI
ncbi:MAG TPA: response regulator transcription factor [Candidatus Acidoferrales bacterium]|jgi:NarL family two-component system response regulator YdfI|nr:response regulator transcription factor [Candidatus Acidoferrales bacterium]